MSSNWNSDDEMTRLFARMQIGALLLIPVFIALWTVAALVRGA